ncbi:AMP-binding protein [Martelella mediterranea]|uniref:Short-chain-fatty-acid--CoA ligase n=1 Tax=Martelella mediterranea DSM 17316 TaxID=1122214 RepID=A0A1U9YWU7_9HYPH|nr:AMP-binding protein [Martelella mediterranea]AQZ49906.1 Short-chain-fatty-acid--CoA ligase [Martelella mediterranea DSM 17316]
MNVLDKRLAELKAAGRILPADGESLGAIALAKAEADPERIVVIDSERTLSRGEIVDLALRLGGGLLARGLRPGDAIGFQLPNWWEACVINMAAALFGFRIVPLMTIYRAAELRHMLPTCGIRAVFIPEMLGRTDFPALHAGLDGLDHMVLTVRAGEASPDSFEALIATPPAEPSLPDFNDIKTVFFTSGSTGMPKAVLHSHASMDSFVRSTSAFWGITGQDRFYIPSPIGHIGGSIYAFEFPWISDITAILTTRWDPDLAVAEIDAHRATFMAGATPFLVNLIAASERADTRLPSLRRFICGGASVPPQLIRRGLERFANAVVSRAYGSSEVPVACPGIRTRAEAEAFAETDGEIEAEMLILDPEGRVVADGEIGEIAARAPRMLIGYLDPAHEEGNFRPDGYFMMGDLGRRIEGRFLEITGRTKDIIIRKGENLSPLEIENALMQHPAVRQCAIVGIPDEERGEMVVAFVVPQAGYHFDFAIMDAHLTEFGLARQKFPERLHVVEELPTTAIGKVRKSDLREIAIGEADTVES